MSRIGTLEQMSLTNLLQRLESFAKSGLLVVQQGGKWVELYFRGGRLICIGPVRVNTNIGNRLLQEGLISPQALQETLRILGGAEASETKVALALMDRGHISQETLRDWSTKKAYEVLQVLFSWSTGEVHFVEDVVPSEDRLLVGVTISTLLPALTGALRQSPSTDALKSSGQAETTSPTSGPLQPQLTRASELPNIPTLTSPDQFGLESGLSAQHHYAGLNGMQSGVFTPPSSAPLRNNAANAIFTPEPQSSLAQNAGNSPLANVEGPGGADAFVSILGATGNDTNDDSAFVSFLEGASDGFEGTSGRRQPEPVQTAFTPKRIDTSFMRPEMLLLPVDFSAGLAQNPSVQMTPEQWMVFVQVDGQTSLQRVCLNLGTSPAQVCQVVGELLAAGLIQLSMPDGSPTRELSPSSRDVVTGSMNTGYIAPGYAAMAVPPWSPPTPGARVAGNGFEVQSQWGNSGNGAKFIPGQGGTATSQPLQTSRPLKAPPTMYAPVGGNR